MAKKSAKTQKIFQDIHFIENLSPVLMIYVQDFYLYTSKNRIENFANFFAFWSGFFTQSFLISAGQ